MGYRLLAEVVMLTHFAFLAYLLLGGFLAWWRPRLLLPHALVVAWGVLSVTAGVECPLSVVEHWARVQAGQAGLRGSGFIETYLTGVVYPAEDLGLVRGMVALVVVVSWVGVGLRVSGRWPATGSGRTRRPDVAARPAPGR